jgi:hypothetical protein
LTKEENLILLKALKQKTLGAAVPIDDSEPVVLGVVPGQSPIHGEQEGSSYEAHFQPVSYHPISLFNYYMDSQAAKLSPANMHRAVQILAGARHCGTVGYK